MGQALMRFVLGGVVVALFAVVGDVLRPKRFAGVFGAAPAVALPALALTIMDKGAGEAAVQGRSMMAGAAAFLAYSIAVSFAVDHLKLPGWLLTGGAWVVWLAVAFAIWGLVLR